MLGVVVGVSVEEGATSGRRGVSGPTVDVTVTCDEVLGVNGCCADGSCVSGATGCGTKRSGM